MCGNNLPQGPCNQRWGNMDREIDIQRDRQTDRQVGLDRQICAYVDRFVVGMVGRASCRQKSDKRIIVV